MSRLFFVAVAFVAAACLSESNSSAQHIGQGYQFAAGFQAAGFGSCGGTLFRSMPREQLPYFAQYPPVYYSHIVPRPYGVSPYASPAGIVPVEMSIPAAAAPSTTTINNPFFKRNVKAKLPEVTPANEPANQKTNTKTTLNKKIVNPHFTPALELAEKTY
jgi:hypothetical protein